MPSIPQRSDATILAYNLPTLPYKMPAPSNKRQKIREQSKMCDKASCCQRVGAPRKLVSLEDLKAELRRVFEAEDGKVDVELIKSLLGAYKSNREDWKQYAKFDAHRLVSTSLE